MTDESASILIVDDEFSVRDSLTSWFRKDGLRAIAAKDGPEALDRLREGPVDIAIVDIKMPGMDGIELQSRIHALDPEIQVIIITAYASVDTAVRALKQGAFDYITKPIDPEELSHLVHRALERRHLKAENVRLRETIDGMAAGEIIVGESPAMRKVMELVTNVAQTDAAVLIRGESGTGKELVARAIHAQSRRRYFPIVAVNCGAVPEGLIESELFGHEKGAFTGAYYQRKGKIELASGGTLFLDEVGALSLEMQATLLRVLETKEFTRVGGTKALKVDFRAVYATNEDLRAAMKTGRFREDLFWRLNVFVIEIPPLRERRSDIPLLAAHFVQRFALEMEKRIVEIDEGAMAVLLAHDWPGNVRELANAIERAMVVGKPPAIRRPDLPVLGGGVGGEPPAKSLAEVEKRHIARILVEKEWNITRAAEMLEIDRATLYSKIKKYGLRSEP
jgi:DNA-binding NtrC family response regulator